jgi:signal transduction histidine kinase
MEVRDQERAVAYVVADPALLEDDELRDVLCVYALGWARNRRLTRDLARARRELDRIRSAQAAEAHRERDRIRRNLHDGAQQRLVAVQVHLAVAGETLRRDPDAGAELLEVIGPQLEAAIDELRILGRGDEPPLLAEHGLAVALRAVVGDAPLPVVLDAVGIGRYPAEVESAVYFTCLEALQNAVRHARAKHGFVWLREGAELGFAVTDDGVGFVAAERDGGAGLGNMRARIEAVGGTIVMRSRPGAGTEVRGSVPLVADLGAAAGTPGSRITRKA